MVSRNYYLKRKLQGLLFLGCVLGMRFSFQKRSRKTKSLVNFILNDFKYIKILNFHYDIVLQGIIYSSIMTSIKTILDILTLNHFEIPHQFLFDYQN